MPSDTGTWQARHSEKTGDTQLTFCVIIHPRGLRDIDVPQPEQFWQCVIGQN